MNEHMEAALIAKLEQIRRDMQRNINADLFHDGSGRLGQYPKPKPWPVRWRGRFRAYVSTLWKALRGVELEEPSEWD